MTSEEYAWKQNAQVSLDAQAVGALFKEMAETNTGLTPGLVVDRAKPDDSILHGYFTWDDQRAGHNWRIEQARYLIRQLVVVKTIDGETPEPVRAFVSVRKESKGDKPQHIYLTVTDAIRDKSYRQQLLDEALKEICAWRVKYAAFQELARIFDVIEAVNVNGVNGKHVLLQPA